MTRIHVSPLDWEGSGSPSVGARCPAGTVPPSQRVAVPAAQGQRAGLPEGFGRAKTANRHPPSVGPGCCPGWRWRWPPRIVGGWPAGANGACAVTVRGTRGRVRGACVAEVGHTRRARSGGGSPSMASPPAPLRGGCYTRPAGGGGAPLPVYRGAVWPGRASQAVPRGRRVWLPPPPLLLGRPSRAPCWGSHPGGGAEQRRWRRRGAPASVQGPIKKGQAGPTGVGRGRRRLRAVTVPPLPPPSWECRPLTSIP